MKKRFPGAFISILGENELPSAQFLLTEKEIPLDGLDRLPGLGCVGLSNAWDAWTSAEWPPARFTFSRPSRLRHDAPVITVAGRRYDIASFRERPSNSPSEDETNWHLAQLADDYLQGLLIRWAYFHLLVGHRRRLAKWRDYRLRQVGESWRVIHGIKQIRQLNLSELQDAETAAHEIKLLTKKKWRFHREVIELAELQPVTTSRKPVRWLDEAQATMRQQANELLAEVANVRAALITDSSLRGVASNIRLQRLVVVLSIASVAVAAAAAWVSLRAH